ncbi:MAG: hypothetical protein JNM93_11335 [Bacteriovoracaceae bacterium]|nr:hypothetical protein [Bacteriovoracaceae bacterium]
MANDAKVNYSISSLKYDTQVDEVTLSDVEKLIEMGVSGHFPLFYKEWFDDSSKSVQPIALAQAKKNINDTVVKLSGHRSYERKKEALFHLNETERNLFIQSFLRIVENRILDKESTQLQ